LLGSIYIPNFRKFYQTVWILPIFFIFGQFWLFFWPKNAKIEKQFFLEFSFVRKYLRTNFRKFYQTVWILPIFFIFSQFWLFFWPKKAKIEK